MNLDELRSTLHVTPGTQHRRGLTTTRVGLLSVTHDGVGYVECNADPLVALAGLDSALSAARERMADLEAARQALVAHYIREMDPWRET